MWKPEVFMEEQWLLWYIIAQKKQQQLNNSILLP